jgi:hypothetical protein
MNSAVLTQIKATQRALGQPDIGTGNPNVAAPNAPKADQVTDDDAHQIDGNGEADSLGTWNDRCIYADYLAERIQ